MGDGDGGWGGTPLRIGLNGSRFKLILQPLFTEEEETDAAAHSFLSNISRTRTRHFL